jgi:hypothetical protein
MYLIFINISAVEGDEDMPECFIEALKSVTQVGSKIGCKNRSHSLKRNAVQMLQEFLPAHSFIARCGFLAKNIHTMFDYFFNSQNQDHKSAQVLAGWLHIVEGVVQGGIAPDCSAIKTARGKVKPFVNTLFRRSVSCFIWN